MYVLITDATGGANVIKVGATFQHIDKFFFLEVEFFKKKTKPKHVSFFLLYFKNNMSEEYYIYIFVIALFSGAVFHVYKVRITSYAMK